ncbi:hypothetical protein LAZ67_X004182 [Cordylochernes scorpioides]|uniref:Uncharacterized protein n=1 Tax=Cordylochernes scorpioides TaxID=51811 RepID=A0ABY6LZK9_9ARAC|nr:hypothetical protein LAZ67_X004182 [Cordylochernes scorpioides]
MLQILKYRATGQRGEPTLFTDKKLFTLEQVRNNQNARNWSTEAPGMSAIIKNCQNPQLVMRLAPGFHSRVKAKTTFQDDDVPIDDMTTNPLFRPQEKGRKATRDSVPIL